MSDSITMLIEERIASENFSLPVFPPVATEVQAAIQANAEISAIEAIILRDQSLSTEILKLANSAFYAGLARQKTIHQALVRLGVKRVFNIVMFAAQRQVFMAKNKALNGIMETLWQHAAISASSCRWLAIRCGNRNGAEDAFLAGLLHDLGSLIVLKALDEIPAEKFDGELTLEVVREVIQTLHTDFGHQVMQFWELPEEYAEVARDHHQCSSDSSNQLLPIVRLVDAACQKLSIGMNHDPEIVLEMMPEFNQLGLSDIHLAELEIEMEDKIESM